MTNLSIQWPDGLDDSSFLEQYWQKKSLLIRGAFPDFENPVSPDELGGLALDEEINSRIILRESDTQWHLKHGPFAEDELTSLPSTDWSLLVSDIEKHLDGFHQYLSPFRFIPDWRIDDLMISYAPKGASAGPHIDQYDVFLFQASGHREWKINTDSNDQSILPGLDMRILADFKATDQWLLAPGDMLYLPPGVAHHGISDDDECMTWSIGFRAPSHAELFTDIAQQIALKLDENVRYGDPHLIPQFHPGEISADAIGSIHSLWKKIADVDKDTFNQVLGAVLTQRSHQFPAEEDHKRTEEEFFKAISEADLTRDPVSRVSFIDQNNEVLLFVDGESYSVTRELAQLLCESFEYTGQAIKKLCNDDQNNLCLVNLWQRNILSRL